MRPYRHSPRQDVARGTGRALLMLAVVVGGACSGREPPQSPEQPCTAGAGLSGTAGASLYQMSTTLREAPFAVSLVPTVPVPVRVGTELGFQLSSGTAGYASLYVIDPVYAVQVMAENLPVPAGSLEYPSSQGFTLRAVQPVGFNRAILLVTRQPFSGFSGNDTLTAPVSTALDGRTFLSELNEATGALPPSSWAASDVCMRVVG